MSALSSRLASLAIAAAIASGCASDKTGWSYSAEPLAVGAPVAEVDLAVPKFADRRDGEDRGSLLLSMVPLVPYADAEHVRPEESWPADDFMPQVDLARALAEEIESARLFRNVALDGTAPPAAYVLEGAITSTHLRVREVLYGASVYGIWAWMFGAPAGMTWNELRVDLALRRANEPEVLWSFSVDERLQDTLFMHDLPLVPFHYDALWKRAMEKVIPSLREAAANL